MNTKLKILMMGPQGSGKGTQADLLSESLGIPSFGMGQLIRDEIATGSDYGIKLHAIIVGGNLISDTDAAGLLKLRLAREDAAKGYILDGYPRNSAQFNAFDFDTPTHVIVIDITRAESLKRLGGRLTCQSCGKVSSLHLGTNAGDPCLCGGQFVVRDDDRPEAIARRLEIYQNDTRPVIERYQNLVHHIDGVGSIEQVHERIVHAIQTS
jgi:adenylate kinase